MKSVTMTRRLIGVEDIAFDISGTGETFDEVFKDGKRRPITKINAGVLPLTTGTSKKIGAENVDSAISALDANIKRISGGGEGEDMTKNITSSMTAAEINLLFASIPRDLRGGTLTINFPENAMMLIDDTLIIKDVFNGRIKINGNFCTLGNMIDGNVSKPDITILKLNCQCLIDIDKLTFLPDSNTAQTPTVELSSGCFSLTDCIFALTNGVREVGLKIISATGSVNNCKFDGIKTANLITENSTFSFFNTQGGMNVSTAFEIKGSHCSIVGNRLTGLIKSDNVVGGNPVGTVIAFAGTTSPDGYLICDGRTLQKIDYPNLSNVIGNTYGGSGDVFKLPDLRGEFIRGADSGRGINSELTVGKWKDCAVESGGNHVFSKSGKVWFPGIGVDGSVRVDVLEGTIFSGENGSLGTLKLQAGVDNSPNVNNILNLKINDTISRDGNRKTDKETRPRSVSMLYCIRY